ncbi:MAG: hypothetical protein C0444_03140 [Microbacterium sp.]|nr:hypothetical protein [Microbacterium sp.]
MPHGPVPRPHCRARRRRQRVALENGRGADAEHATAPTAADTNVARIATLYAHLSEVAPSPIVDLNRAIAVAFSEGPDAGLALIDTLHLDAHLGEYHMLHATRADLLRRIDEAGLPVS